MLIIRDWIKVSSDPFFSFSLREIDLYVFVLFSFYSSLKVASFRCFFVRPKLYISQERADYWTKLLILKKEDA